MRNKSRTNARLLPNVEFKRGHQRLLSQTWVRPSQAYCEFQPHGPARHHTIPRRIEPPRLKCWNHISQIVHESREGIKLALFKFPATEGNRDLRCDWDVI